MGRRFARQRFRGVLWATFGLVALASLPSRAAVSANGADQSIKVGIGEDKVLVVHGGISRVAVGMATIADVRTLSSSEVLILGVSQGKTTLLIWRNSGRRLSYTISVRKHDPEEVAAELSALLGEIEGVRIRIIGDDVYLDGETLTTEDAQRVQAVIKLFPEVRSFVRPSPEALKLQAKNLARAFAENGLNSVVVNVIGGSIFLEGTVESQQDLQKAQLIVKAMGSQVNDLLTVGIKRMVLVEAQVVEIRRNVDDGFGITYPTDLTSTEDSGIKIGYQSYNPPQQGQLPQQTTLQLTGGLTSDFAVRLRWDYGYGRLLSQPKLVCASGEKAHFIVGGEVPIPLITLNNVTVDWKEFGVILDVTPTADRQGNISIKIAAEVSNIDSTLSVNIGGNTYPGFRKRRVETSVTVKHGETIVLSGLFNYDQQKNVSKVPILGHIPLIGELFKSREFINQKNEIAIFVTPTIVNPDSDRIRETIDKIKERYEDANEAVNFSIWD